MTPTDMQGKICLVTGSTSGLGKATAFALAQQHATVILGCRDKLSTLGVGVFWRY
jgi:NAD(P)-dependent dehydrogenase (short-subunit alcohol dehydrogenase family)